MAAVLTNVGEDWVCQRLAGSGAMSSNNGSHVGIGTGATGETKGDTALVTEVETRATTTVSVTGSGATAKYQAAGAAITATTSRAIQEAGLFSASTTGNMYIRATFTTINLATNDTLAVTFTIDPS